MARWRCTAVVAVLLACAVLASAARGPARRLRDDSEDWGEVEVKNECPYALSVLTGYTHDAKLDKGHPCPNAVEDKDIPKLSYCAADEWVVVSPGESAVLSELPTRLWSFSAFVNGSVPRHFITRKTEDAYPEAFLGLTTSYTTDCESAEEDEECVWWAVPELSEDGSNLVLTCPGYDPDAEPEVAEVSDVTIVNKCKAAVQVKFVYAMAEGDKGEGCLIKGWYGEERRCITDWQSFEPKEERYIGQTVDPSWTYAARLADDTSVDLGAEAPGAFQGTNETLACPKKDFYGSGYTCEWWAPKCYFCDLNATISEPLVITCKD